MTTPRRLFRIAPALVLLALALPSPAFGQATRTFVSGVGDDLNPCSRTAPCKTFAGAISKTAAGGEINCLDPAGYGTLTITKAISIYCEGTIGGGLAAGGQSVSPHNPPPPPKNPRRPGAARGPTPLPRR